MAYIKTPKPKDLINSLPNCEGYLIAYSGGADSTALLHLFSQVENVRAIHINHGLQEEANDWQNHCQQICEKLGIELIIEQANLKDASENSCRKARYEFFKKHLQPYEILLTAHHAQDQAETILLKLLRGTGIGGLTGIDKLRQFSKGFIARPLLDYSPEQLKNYLKKIDANWIEDGSNNDNSYRRNYIRNEVLPSLQSEFPQAIENINRCGNNSKNSLDLLNHLCDFQDKSLPIYKLLDLPSQLQATLVYHWLSQKGIPTPDSKTLKQITSDFIHAAVDKKPYYKNIYYQLFRSQGAIFCIENFKIIDSETTFQWNTHKPFVFPNKCGTLTYHGNDNFDLVVKFNQGTQKLQTHWHRFHKKTKKLFQENHIPTWERQNTPFIYLNNKLISLGFDWSSCAVFKSKFKLTFSDLKL